MNRPPEEFKRIAENDLLLFATACLQQAGMPGDQASLLARCLVNSDLRGVRSHGTRALGGYCGALRGRAVNPDPDVRVLKETDVAIHIDGGGGLGYSPMMMATEAAVRKARAKGVAVGAACNIGHYGSAGHYVRRAMEEGCTAFSVQGAYPQYYESNEGKRAMYYGNPPLSFGLPSASEPPVVLDAATCIMADYWRGPEYEALETLIPAAFFKSMGYTAVASALGGVFVGLADEACRETKRKYPSARTRGDGLGSWTSASSARRTTSGTASTRWSAAPARRWFPCRDTTRRPCPEGWRTAWRRTSGGAASASARRMPNASTSFPGRPGSRSTGCSCRSGVEKTFLQQPEAV